MFRRFGGAMVSCRSRVYPVVVVLLSLPLLMYVGVEVVDAQLRVGFYDKTCPQVESLVQGLVASAVAGNKGLGAGLLRLHFHDCFVQGCDGSVLIDSTVGSPAEKDAPPNAGSLRGYEVIDSAKSAVESVCPGVVSCADILTFAARDSVVQLGGPSWAVQAGRRDGSISTVTSANANLPPFTANVAQLTQSFAVKGLSLDEMVTLSGAHTVGGAHCTSFTNRLHSFNTSSARDPTMNQELAQSLTVACPQSNLNPSALLDLDVTTANVFDNVYYSNLLSGKGVLTSDQVLFEDATTRAIVQANAVQGSNWTSKFTQAMVKMGTIEVKTGSQGEIRRTCRAVNSLQSAGASSNKSASE